LPEKIKPIHSGLAGFINCALKNSICAIWVCSYVASMNWQQFLPLLIVLGVGVVFVWRSSSPQKHDHDCGCGCTHKDDPETRKDNTAR